MLSKKILTLLGMCLVLGSNVLAADLGDEVKSRKPLVPVTTKVIFSSRMEESISYFSGTDSPKKQRLSRDELLRQAALRSQNSLSVPSKPVRLFVDEDEQPLSADLSSLFEQYNRGDA